VRHYRALNRLRAELVIPRDRKYTFVGEYTILHPGSNKNAVVSRIRLRIRGLTKLWIGYSVHSVAHPRQFALVVDVQERS
jgi:hypothetical protein